MICDYCNGLQHIGIPTTNMEETINFYQVMGFKIILDTVVGLNRMVILSMGNVTIEIYEVQQSCNIAGAIDHIAIDVNDINLCYSQAKADEFKIISNGIEELPIWKKGIQFFVIEGINGEKIEFSQKL